MAIRTLSSVIEQHIAGLPGVVAALIGRATDGAVVAKVIYASDAQEEKELEFLGAYASDLLQANNRICRIVSPKEEADYLIAGSPRLRVIIKSFPESPYFVLFLTKATTDLKSISERIKAILIDGKPLLPPVQDSVVSAAQALMDYAKRYAPDPNFVALRLSLKTGIDRIRLEKGNLSRQELRTLYKAVAALLGRERLPIAIQA
jgi:predicted regulator of Ras-like GTPase activity (Roadblock/LC7/MglB family)